MNTILIRNARAVNRGRVFETDIYIKDGRIEQLAPQISRVANIELDAAGKTVLPGIIDDQVHFREPGLTHKANIFSESRAAVAGGVTSFMEMPNTNPTTTTQERLAEKYEIGRQTSLANYSFFMGATNDNLEEVLKTDPKTVCGVKAFMGSSTGNMLVDDPTTLENLFSRCPMLIATHCEDEATVRKNNAKFQKKYGDALTAAFHPKIRSAAACLKSSSLAVDLAKKHGTRLHILHISTADELALFENTRPLAEKRITAEVCVHHLFFNSSNYATLGNQIKCNPAIKSRRHQAALLPALLDDRLDIIATDHAPHTWDEKSQSYIYAPSGLPLVQHALPMMLDFYHRGLISLEKIVEKMCHAPAVCFKIKERGFLDEGAWADLSIVDLEKRWKITPENLFYKCKWSPLLGKTMRGQVETTIVSGYLAYQNGRFLEGKMGERVLFLG
jgi:dihydroorotase